MATSQDVIHFKTPDGNLIPLPANPTPEEREKVGKLLTHFKQQEGLKSKAKAEAWNASESTKVLDQTFRGGLLGLPVALMQGGEWAAKKTADALGLQPKSEPKRLSRMVLDATGGDISRPQTEGGKMLGHAGETIVSALAGPGRVIHNLAIGLGAAAGGELGARVAGKDSEGLGRALGSLAGGVTTGGLSAIMAPAKDDLIRQGFKGLDPKDIEQAKQTAKTLSGYGMPNIITQHVPEKSLAPEQVELISAHPDVRGSLKELASGVSEKAQKVVAQKLNEWLPPSVETHRKTMLGIQESAKAAEKALLDKANAKFTAAMPQPFTYGEIHMTELRKKLIDAAQGLKLKGSEGGKDILKYVDDHFPINPQTKIVDAMGSHELNNKIKDLNMLAASEKSPYKGLPLGDMKAIMKAATPEFEAARAAKTKVMESEVKPFRQSLAGIIANMGGGPNDSKYTVTKDLPKLVFDNRTDRAREIMELGRHIGPESMSYLLREHLVEGMTKAAKPSSGVSWQAPSRFVDDIFGTEVQKKNVTAAIRVVTGGKKSSEFERGLKDLTQAFHTYRNLLIRPTLDQASMDEKAARNIMGYTTAPASSTRRTFSEITQAKVYKELIEKYTSPEHFDDLIKIANTKEPLRKQAILRTIIINANDPNATEDTGINNK